MQLINKISHDYNIVANGPVCCWKSAAIGAIEELAGAFLVREFKSNLFYEFSHTKGLTYLFLVMLMCAVHAKCVTITPIDMVLIDSLHIINGGKSYDKMVYTVYTTKMSVSINLSQSNKQYCSL
jgi:hypothetical protein